jgi:hypothetical protein
VVLSQNPEFTGIDAWFDVAGSACLIASALVLARIIGQITSAQRDYLIAGAIFA